jgi:hypothetical protein
MTRRPRISEHRWVLIWDRYSTSFVSRGCQHDLCIHETLRPIETVNAIHTTPFHPSIAIYGIRVNGNVVSTITITSLVVSVIQNKSCLELQRNDESADGRPISMSATMREQATIYCTVFSLQVCFLLSEKSIRQNPPPSVRITFRGSRSQCTIPIL